MSTNDQWGAGNGLPLNLDAVQADDNMIDAIVVGADMTPTERQQILELLDNRTVSAAAPEDQAALLAAVLGAWRSEAETNALRELVDTDRALITLRKSRKAYRRWWRRALRSLRWPR